MSERLILHEYAALGQLLQGAADGGASSASISSGANMTS